MKFEDIIAEFGKPLHELSDEEVKAIAQRLDAPELERFEVHVKEVTKTERKPRISKAGKENVDEFMKMKLKAKAELEKTGDEKS